MKIISEEKWYDLRNQIFDLEGMEDKILLLFEELGSFQILLEERLSNFVGYFFREEIHWPWVLEVLKLQENANLKNIDGDKNTSSYTNTKTKYIDEGKTFVLQEISPRKF